MSKFPYYKSLDGVRGLAVLMVVCIHSRLMPFGWIGVQIFFVLSGFLITGILLTQTDRPFNVFLGQFYWRRGLRIWPLYFLFLALCGIAYRFLSVPETWPAAWPRLASFTYNFARISPQFADSDYYGHFWTLCVEEQFYLLWPFAVFFLSLKTFRRFVLSVVLAGPLIRFLTGLYFANRLGAGHALHMAIHSLPMSHLDAFASGALIAVAPSEIRRRWAPKAIWILAGLLLLTAAAGLAQSWVLSKEGLPPHWLALGYDELAYHYQYVWGYTALNLSTAALIFCATENNLVSRWFSFRPLVFIGMISYGIYVWHLPLMRVFSLAWPAGQHTTWGLLRFAVYVPTTIGVASVSYYGFERYFLRMKRRLSSRSEGRRPAPASSLTGQTEAPQSTDSGAGNFQSPEVDLPRR